MGSTAAEPVVVLISGRGSNMRALLEASREMPRIYEVVRVVSDQPAAPGLKIASDLGTVARVVPSKAVDRTSFEHSLAAAIDEARPSLIVLAGFMRILSAEFVDRYAGRILNIHPSLLPAHAGLHTHRRVLQARDPIHGATVHFVTADLDGGPAVIQARLQTNPTDDEVSLAARVQLLEHHIYPEAVRWFCEGRLRCRDGRAWLDGTALEAPVLYDGDGPTPAEIPTWRGH